MILLDTNVLIYAADRASPYRPWARATIADAVAGEGAAINAVILAEVCVGDLEPDTVAIGQAAQPRRFPLGEHA